MVPNYSSPRGGFGYNQPRQQYSPQQRMLYESPKNLRTSPHQQKQNYSKGHIARQSNSDTNVSSQPRQQNAKDMHQVIIFLLFFFFQKNHFSTDRCFGFMKKICLFLSNVNYLVSENNSFDKV